MRQCLSVGGSVEIGDVKRTVSGGREGDEVVRVAFFNRRVVNRRHRERESSRNRRCVEFLLRRWTWRRARRVRTRRRSGFGRRRTHNFKVPKHSGLSFLWFSLLSENIIKTKRRKQVERSCLCKLEVEDGENTKERRRWRDVDFTRAVFEFIWR